MDSTTLRALRVEIAELMGAVYWQSGGERVELRPCPPTNVLWFEVPKPERFIISDLIPDYPSDLNAMHDAEAKLLRDPLAGLYDSWLWMLLRQELGNGAPIMASWHIAPDIKARALIATVAEAKLRGIWTNTTTAATGCESTTSEKES